MGAGVAERVGAGGAGPAQGAVEGAGAGELDAHAGGLQAPVLQRAEQGGAGVTTGAQQVFAGPDRQQVLEAAAVGAAGVGADACAGFAVEQQVRFGEAPEGLEVAVGAGLHGVAFEVLVAEAGPALGAGEGVAAVEFQRYGWSWGGSSNRGRMCCSRNCRG